MTEHPVPNDTRMCPLCGKPNDCAVAAGQDAEACWCMTATMSSSALASIPPEAQGKICICAQCASGPSRKD
jgi:hypothetical protein